MASATQTQPADWDKFADTFRALVEEGPGIPPAKAMLSSVDKILPFCEATTVLDIGCGPGQITNLLLKKYGTALSKDTTVIAADNSSTMLEKIEEAKSVSLAHGTGSLWEKVRSQLCDVQEMPAIASGSISHVLAGFVLFFPPGTQKTMSEVSRVLKPGGVMSSTSWKSSEWMDISMMMKVVRPDTPTPKFDPDWMSVDGVQRIFGNAGYEKIEVSAVETFWDYESPEAIVNIILGFPFSQMVMKSWSPEEIESYKALGVGFLEEKYGRGPGTMKGACILGTGCKAQ